MIAQTATALSRFRRWRITQLAVRCRFHEQQGDGGLVFLQKVFGAFFQDQITINDRLSITPGIRYDWQNIFTDNNNVAPRV